MENNLRSSDKPKQSELVAFISQYWERFALALLVGVVAYIFFFVPTYSTYDSDYSLIWAREILDFQRPSFDAYNAPTQHPLGIFVSLFLVPFGSSAERLMILVVLVSFVFLIWGVYSLGKSVFTPLVGLIAALVLFTRFDYLSFAMRGYIDIPYAAFVVWAAVWQVRGERRGAPVLILLACAGLLRPEAWLLSGIYFLYLAWRADWSSRIKYALLTASAPVIWSLIDLFATGDPIYSFNSTNEFVSSVDRTITKSEIPGAIEFAFDALLKAPILTAVVVGGLLSIVLVPKRVVVPVTIVVSGVFMFALVTAGGLAPVHRYLMAPAATMTIFAGFLLAGWTVLERESRLKIAWAIGAVVIAAYGVYSTATNLNFRKLRYDPVFWKQTHNDMQRLLASPEVKQALNCGPVTMPNHKLIPDIRWTLDLPEDKVQSRTDPSLKEPATEGVAIFVNGRRALVGQIYSSQIPRSFSLIEQQVPRSGFKLVARSGYYSAYVNCSDKG